MGGYFSGIQSWFDSGYHGRHLGLILREIGSRRPDAFNHFISKATGISARELKNCSFEVEFRFKGKSGWRRADLALISNESNRPIVLVEIKYRDKPLPGTDTKPAQLSDYLFWKGEKQGRHVLVLSQDHIAENGLAIKRWSEFARELRAYASDSELVSMLIEYLEDEGVVMQNIDSRALLGFMKRMLCGWKGAGMLVNNPEGPAEFSHLLKNLKLLAIPFDRHFKDAWSKTGEDPETPAKSKCATIDFSVQNKLKTDQPEKIFEEGTLIDRSAKDGGRFFVLARYSLGHGHGKWLRVSFGLEFRIEPKSDKSSPPSTYIFAEAYGGAIDDEERHDLFLRKKITFEQVTDKAERYTERTERKIHSLLTVTLQRLSQRRSSLTREQKKAIKLLLKSLVE
jgi:hypothetical protein